MELRNNIIGSKKPKWTEQIYSNKDKVKTFHGFVFKKDNASSINSPIGSDESTMIASYVPSGVFLKNSTAESRKEVIML